MARSMHHESNLQKFANLKFSANTNKRNTYDSKSMGRCLHIYRNDEIHDDGIAMVPPVI